MIIVESGAYPQEGIGKPDYTKDISRAIQRAGISLEYNQRLRIFGRQLTLGGDPEYPLVPNAPLAPGANTHLTDLETLLPMPITIPAGYLFSFLTASGSLTQDAQVYSIVDDYWANCWFAAEGGVSSYLNRVIDITTAWIDPTGAAPHIIDVKLYNVGGGDLYGSVGLICVQEKLGTPEWPTTKVCRCPHCGNEEEFPVTTTRIICSTCGKLYIVCDFSRFRRTP